MATRLSDTEARALFGNGFIPGQMTFLCEDGTYLVGSSSALTLATITSPDSLLGGEDQVNLFHTRSSHRSEQTPSPSTTDDLIIQGRDFPRSYDEDAHSASGNTEHALALRIPDSHLTDAVLVETRQARHLAGLDTSELDNEIARRILYDPRSWGWVGREVAVRGWVDDSEAVRRMQRVRREEYPRYLWAGRRVGRGARW
ncbi:hypothetical protein NX059_001715 [Plenodomus lindquistii]|nr:hypothetical protein NX059_001715 [Plenodomus lindquistii]